MALTKSRFRVALVSVLAIMALASLAFGGWALAKTHRAHGFKSKLGIHWTKKTNDFHGKVHSAKFCQAGRLVKVYRETGGVNTFIDQASSDSTGHWSGIAAPRSGKYF